jgi:hypothetical protein
MGIPCSQWRSNTAVEKRKETSRIKPSDERMERNWVTRELAINELDRREVALREI